MPYRIGVALAGFLVIVGGIVLLPLPGPGWVIIFLGLGIWASEFAWAARLLAFTRRTLRSWTRWYAARFRPARLLLTLAALLAAAAAVWTYLAWRGLPFTG